MNEEKVTKAEAARRFGVSRTMVTKYVQRGLPVTPEGMIEWGAAKLWHAANIIPQLSGNYATRMRQKGCGPRGTRPRRQAPDRQSGGPRPEEAQAYRRLLDRLAVESGRLPELLLGAGVKDMALVVGAIDAFDSIVTALAGSFWDVAYPEDDWNQQTADQPDYGELAQRYGITTTDSSEWECGADELTENLHRLLNPQHADEDAQELAGQP